MSGGGPSLRSERARVAHLGSARSGTRHNGHMRLTSMALIPLTVAFVLMVLTLAAKDYNGVRGYLGHPLPAILMLLFVGAGIYHMQLGMRTIIEDYIHGSHAKDAALMANLFFCIGLGCACVYALLRISFT